MSAEVMSDLFHNCALRAYAEAMLDGKHMDSEYVRTIAYRYYEMELRIENERKNI